MARNEKRAVIKYLNLKGLTLSEVSSDMKVVLGNDAPLYATIHRWIAEFQRGRELTEDAHTALAALWCGLQQGVCSMGTTNVNARKQAGPSHNFMRQSVSIQHGSGQVSPRVGPM